MTKTPLPIGRLAYDMDELAAALGVSLRTLQREARDGHLKIFHIRTRAMVTPAEAERYLKMKQKESRT